MSTNERRKLPTLNTMHPPAKPPDGAELWEERRADAMARLDEPSRRRFLELVGASIALAGLTGCVKDPIEKILPYTKKPVDVTPGTSRYYATSSTHHGYATGLLVESREGRPIKIEGNSLHPASLGGTGVLEQASILDLYDPYRARSVLRDKQIQAWENVAQLLAAPRNDAGAGLRIMLEPTASPLMGHLLTRVLERYPRAKITFYDPIDSAAGLDGMALLFGRRLQRHYDVSQASVIVSLGADFMSSMPMHLRHARDFARKRRPAWPNPTMNRLYVVETKMTSTGSLADHHISRRGSDIEQFAAALAAEILMTEGTPESAKTPEISAALRTFFGREDRGLIIPMARDLRRAAPNAVVMVGDEQPAAVHALGAWMNLALGNTDVCTYSTAPVLVELGASGQTFAALVTEMQNGAVDTLVMLGVNPVYSAPGDQAFAQAMGRVPSSIHLGMHFDETSEQANWFVPELHYLESWGDARAYDGTPSIVQPLIRPLFGGHSSAEIVALLAGTAVPNIYDLLQEFWRARLGNRDFAAFWDSSLRRGVIAGSESPKIIAGIVPNAGRAMIEALGSSADSMPNTYEIGFYGDSRVGDGRRASNPWLQELPDPMTKLTWGNAALMSARTANALGVENGDLVEINEMAVIPAVPAVVAPGTFKPGIVLPALVMVGHADAAISVAFGYGRKSGGPIALDVGTNVAPLSIMGRTYRRGMMARRKEGHIDLALTQTHWKLEGRPIAFSATLDEYEKNPEFTAESRGRVLSLLPRVDGGDEAWAMTIDTSICSGCSACVAACQAENNIPVVGRDEVLRGREMHWLRIDVYHNDHTPRPSIVHQPMLCQHCEHAPCEYVCPVNATVHSPDGLNEMVYNRCIGTRFCSNNCPYKVRRFNYFDWIEERAALNGDIRRLQKNPEVTVRERGVMEKCTFCVQRIRRTEIKARIESRGIRPGEVTPACAAACPTQAIQFGSLAHRDTTMVAWRNEPRSYAVLNELGTVPRVHYLAAVGNPNPEVK